MKKSILYIQRILFFFLLLCFTFLKAEGQAYYRVTDTSGTHYIGGRYVSVYQAGYTLYNYVCDSVGPYWTYSGGIINYSFSSPVKAITMHMIAINSGDTLDIYMNGVQYYVTSANINCFTTSCSGQSNTVTTHNGELCGTICNSNADIQFFVNPGYPINSFRIYERTAYCGGVTFDFYFSPSCPGVAYATPCNMRGNICWGDTLSLYGSGTGLSGYATYSWTGPNGFTSSLQDPVILHAPAAASGTYTLSINDTGGCSYTATVVVNVDSPEVAVIPSATNMCANGSVVLYATGANTYTWTPAAGLSCTACSQPTASPTSTTTYTVTGTDGQGCKSIATSTITVNPLPTLNPVSNRTFCNNEITGSISFSGTNSSAYAWTNNNPSIGLGSSGGGNIGSFTATNSSSSPITATISVTPSNVYQGIQCFGTAGSFTITINPASATITPTGPDTICTETDTVILNANTGSGYKYKWLLNGSFTGDTTAVFHFHSFASSTTTDTIKVVVTNAYGCPDTSAGVLVRVLAGNCGCGNYRKYTAFKTISGTKNISSFVSGQNYYMNGDVSITGNGTMKNAYIAIDDFKTMYIDSNATDTISTSHLFACNIMWDGINMQSNATKSAQLTINKNTLIEDAYTAVEILKPITPANGNIFTSDSAIFNKNLISIEIDTYNTSSTTVYPFLIRNTVFTSRYGISTAYNSWVTTGSLKAVFGNNGNPFLPPYRLNDPNSYTPVPCNIGNPASVAIAPTCVGKTRFNCKGTASYAGLSIGDASDARYTNLYDNHVYGIQAAYSNIELANNAFINMEGDGVLVNSGFVNNSFFFAQLKLDSAAVNNQFWSCTYNGVEANNYYSLWGRGAKMVGTHSINDSHPDNSYGYKVQTAYSIARVDMSYNTICNLTNGIYFGSSLKVNPAPVIGCTNPAPQLYTSNNRIVPNIFGSITTQYITQGITINGAASSVGYAFPVHADSNTITSYNGISLNTLANAAAIYNWIKVWPYPGQPGQKAQYGIASVNSNYVNVHSNYIASTTTSVNRDSVRCGVYSSNNIQEGVSCNVVDSIGAAFKFAATNSPSKWLGNGMLGDGYGLLLTYKGVIGKQYYKTGDSVIGNGWTGNWNGNWMTYTNGASQASNSILCVRTGPSTNPPAIYNSGLIVGPPWSYSSTSNPINIHTFNTGLDSICQKAPNVTNIKGGDFEPMVLDQVFFGDDGSPIINTADSPVNKWMMQFALYKIMQIDSVWDNDSNAMVYMNMADSSSILYEFDSMAQNSRFAALLNIENAIAEGNLNNAQNLLNAGMTGNLQNDPSTGVWVADYPDADYVVANYTAYYQLLINYMNSALSMDDSIAIISMANMCPFVQGAVVYQARSLYSTVFNTLPMWDDDSLCNAVGAKMVRNNHSGGSPQISNIAQRKQGYSLYPNPNKGKMSIHQQLPDNEAVNAEIWDAEGKCIYKTLLNFTGGKVQLDRSGMIPGLYMLQLRDSKGESFTAKFIVN